MKGYYENSPLVLIHKALKWLSPLIYQVDYNHLSSIGIALQKKGVVPKEGNYALNIMNYECSVA